MSSILRKKERQKKENKTRNSQLEVAIKRCYIIRSQDLRIAESFRSQDPQMAESSRNQGLQMTESFSLVVI